MAGNSQCFQDMFPRLTQPQKNYWFTKRITLKYHSRIGDRKKYAL